MTETLEYLVRDMSCEHCRASVTEALVACERVERVEVDLEKKLVVVAGTSLDDAALRSALEEAGYEAT